MKNYSEKVRKAMILNGHAWLQANPGIPFQHVILDLCAKIDLGYNGPYSIQTFIQTQDDSYYTLRTDEPMVKFFLDGQQYKDQDVFELQALDEDGNIKAYRLTIESPGRAFQYKLVPVSKDVSNIIKRVIDAKNEGIQSELQDVKQQLATILALLSSGVSPSAAAPVAPVASKATATPKGAAKKAPPVASKPTSTPAPSGDDDDGTDDDDDLSVYD